MEHQESGKEVNALIIALINILGKQILVPGDAFHLSGNPMQEKNQSLWLFAAKKDPTQRVES